MVQQTLSQQADMLGRRRARVLIVLAVFYLGQQVSFFASPLGTRTVDHFKISAWVVMSAVLLTLLVTGGAWFRSSAIRSLLNDELTRANRASALGVGFLSAMLAGIVLYVVGTVTPLTDREVIHLIVSIGIGGALIRFGMLERRADRLG
jgi:cation transport ATPase